ncbi:MAG: hypothetical protein HY929_01935 [Euryarchaeota archaeon]|nr:hypothetical protein [Euryarchaeota archaeon]
MPPTRTKETCTFCGNRILPNERIITLDGRPAHRDCYKRYRFELAREQSLEYEVEDSQSRR